AEFVRLEFPEFKLLSISRRSIAAARNVGAAQTDDAIIVFMDADCLPTVDYLVTIDRVLAETTVNVTGSSYVLPPEPGWIESAWHAIHRRERDGQVNLIPSGNLIIRRKQFVEVGGFD